LEVHGHGIVVGRVVHHDSKNLKDWVNDHPKAKKV
jgi:hypothetical protein